MCFIVKFLACGGDFHAKTRRYPPAAVKDNTSLTKAFERCTDFCAGRKPVPYGASPDAVAHANTARFDAIQTEQLQSSWENNREVAWHICYNPSGFRLLWLCAAGWVSRICDTRWAFCNSMSVTYCGRLPDLVCSCVYEARVAMGRNEWTWNVTYQNCCSVFVRSLW
jgi:hypothetical protein